VPVELTQHGESELIAAVDATPPLFAVCVAGGASTREHTACIQRNLPRLKAKTLLHLGSDDP